MSLKMMVVSSFSRANGRQERMDLLGEIGFNFEDPRISVSEKDEVLSGLVSSVDYDSESEVITTIWAVGKYKSDLSVSVLLSLGEFVKTIDTAWQYLISYENIVGNMILPEFRDVIDRVRSYSIYCDKIREAMLRFY